MKWSIRATDPITAINELYLRIPAYESQSGDSETWSVAERIGTSW